MISSAGSLEERGLAAMFSREAASKSERRRRQEAFVAEIELLACIRHPRVTMVIGAVLDREALLVMELMLYGSLHDLYLNTTIDFDGVIVHNVLLDIAQGVEFLHSNKPSIVHGDLKAANILIDEGFRAKVSDFGIALRRGGEGTPYWMAPDRLEGGLPMKSSDAYGFGVTMCETLARAPPFEGESPLEVLTKVCDPNTQLRPTIPQGCGERLARVMRSCWDQNPANRPTMAQVREELAGMAMAEYEGLWSWQQERPGAWSSTASSHMMHACFPPHVAEVLLRGDVPSEDRSECSTVFFADVAGFTAISATMESGKVSNMINRLFLRFDELAAQHEVYKLETIGDCYMAVANLVSNQSHDHVVRVANFSLDVIQAARETLVDEDAPSKGHIEMRVGFDSGPVVGNVVGTRHKKYTVFGNTVNTASRMESTGVPGRIQCTKRAARLLQQQDPRFALVERGAVAVKGRGTMKTYFVEGKASSPNSDVEDLHLEDSCSGAQALGNQASFRRKSSDPITVTVDTAQQGTGSGAGAGRGSGPVTVTATTVRGEALEGARVATAELVVPNNDENRDHNRDQRRSRDRARDQPLEPEGGAGPSSVPLSLSVSHVLRIAEERETDSSSHEWSASGGAPSLSGAGLDVSQGARVGARQGD